MQTDLADFIRDTPTGREAERILRACVHCGFCTATCPTYQLLGDELDGPRGRIYQIKGVLEGEPATPKIRRHLDRCLVCRACETTCPSGVDYHHLLDIGRETVERECPRPLPQRLGRRALAWALGDRRRFAPLLGLARLARPLLPRALKAKIPPRPAPLPSPSTTTQRRMLVLEGCVQPALAPQIDQALALLLGRLGIALERVPHAGCCGALHHHLGDTERARTLARRNIDAWLPRLEAGAEVLLASASGCAAHLLDYPHLLAGDPQYAERARRLADRVRDPVQVLAAEDLDALGLRSRDERIAVHIPCSQQHGLGLKTEVSALLRGLGYHLAQTTEDHLCCGSAGTYSITQPGISARLRERKLRALGVDRPARIVTANIGCLGQLQDPDGVPVEHWLNLLAADLPAPSGSSPATP
ncbi:MAG TPA: glycolate oxidase subunit GlcF [Gammaproteobacteria bacterium]|nr:glycolate oxidase subunit GlcF [Gammaproteobacteria bacterium]